MRNHARISFVLSALFLFLFCIPGRVLPHEGRVTGGKDRQISELQATIDSLKQIQSQLLLQLRQLEQKQNKFISNYEKQRLLEEAKSFLSSAKTKKRGYKTTVFYGGSRQQQALNPNISVTGDFNGHYFRVNPAGGTATEEESRFQLREAEFHIIAPLDPYTRGKFFLGIPADGHLHVGEAYMEWISLPANTLLKIGKFRNQFGILNRYHEHGLPQIDRPLVMECFLGEEGLSGMGIGANWLLPRLWAHVNELNLELVNGAAEPSFAEGGNRDWIVVSHLKNYYDLSQDAYFEWGLSGALGHNDPEGKYTTFLGGLDITYKWQPVNRSKYRTFEFRSEVLVSRREEADGTKQSWGVYAYANNKLNARWWAGVRADYSRSPLDPGDYEWGVAPVLTWWQSEFVFYRLQFNYTRQKNGSDAKRIFLQAVWSMGPHKHEAY